MTTGPFHQEGRSLLGFEDADPSDVDERAHEYGPYRPDEAIRPDIEVWDGTRMVPVEGIPDWLHKQRQQIAEAAR